MTCQVHQGSALTIRTDRSDTVETYKIINSVHHVQSEIIEFDQSSQRRH